MKLLMVNLPVRQDLPPNTPNLGLGCLGASLLARGCEVELLDLNARRFERALVEELVADPAMEVFDAVLVSAMISQFEAAAWFLGCCRRWGWNTAVGGALAAACPELMARYADAVIIGEGEGYDPAIHANGIFRTPIVEDLDSLPLPAYELFDMETYLTNPVGGAANRNKWTTGRGRSRSMLVVSSRGCPRRCSFCHHGYLGLKPRRRSVDSILGEIAAWRERYGITSFSFADDNFTAVPERVLEFCGRYAAGLGWGCAARIDAFADPDLPRIMRESGCAHVGFGLESASPEVLARAGKGLDPDTIRAGLDNLRDSGLDYDYTLILGLPGETPETVRQTIDFCREYAGKGPENIFFATAYPETGLWRREVGYVADQGLPRPIQVQPADYFHLSGHAAHPGRLERYLRALGENDERMIINFSELDDEELMAAMEHMRAELKVRDRKARTPQRVVL